MSELENKLQQAFDALGIKPDQRESLQTYLAIIRKRDEATYNHCLRVGLLSRDAADYYGLDAKALLYAGLLHDLGKAAVDGDVLRKRQGFGEGDLEKIKAHPTIGHDLLAGIHDFTAAIIVRHHRYQAKPYPDNLPQPKAKFSEGTIAQIEMYARLLSVVDFYDATTTRDNERFGGKVTSPDALKNLFLQHKPDDFETAKELIDCGILNNSYAKN
ncbi:MAG: HD domain-containing protein [DPANN group archaeon]|nr:HD domain-containing protein [DPANN group archaeon]